MIRLIALVAYVAFAPDTIVFHVVELIALYVNSSFHSVTLFASLHWQRLPCDVLHHAKRLPCARRAHRACRLRARHSPCTRRRRLKSRCALFFHSVAFVISIYCQQFPDAVYHHRKSPLACSERYSRVFSFAPVTIVVHVVAIFAFVVHSALSSLHPSSPFIVKCCLVLSPITLNNCIVVVAPVSGVGLASFTILLHAVQLVDLFIHSVFHSVAFVISSNCRRLPRDVSYHRQQLNYITLNDCIAFTNVILRC